MANVQGTFYRGETQRRGVNPVSPPNAVDDPVTPVNPPGSGSTTTYKQLGDTADKSFVGKDWHTPVVEDENILRLHPWVRDTGVIAFEGAVFNSATTVDIGAVKAFIADNETDPLNPTLLYVEYAGATNVTVPTVGAGLISYAFLKSDGTIHFQNNPPNSDERKSMVLIFKLGHPTGSINVVANEPDFNNSALQQFRDLFQAFNYINGGVYPYPDASDLSFNTSGGFIVGNGINFVQDNTNPNYSPVSPSVPCSFLYRTQTGVGGGFVSLITPNSYDNSGTITTVGGGSNRTTIQYIFFAPNAGFIVQYGQTIYDSFVDAISAVGKEDFVVYENLIKNAILIGVLVVKRSATDLTNENDARFFRADIFGQLIGSAAGTSVTTLQRAYLNSIIPQIETSIGALTLKNGGGADTDSVFSIENIASAETFAVRGDGVISEGTISPYQLIQEGATDGQVLTWVAANSRYEPVAGGGGGADTNAVHYNAADSKTASQKQQARDNIGDTAGLGQTVSTSGTINNLSRTSNYIKFTGSIVTLTGIDAGVDGEEIALVNFTGSNLFIPGESASSSANNRFKSPLSLAFGQIAIYKYNTNDNRWYIIAGFFYGTTNGLRGNTNVGFGADALSNAKLRSRSETSDVTTSALYLDNSDGTRLASMAGSGLMDIPGNMVVGGPTSIPLTTYSFFVYAKGNTSSQGTIYLNNSSGSLLTVWDGVGDQRSVGGATFGIQRMPTGRVELRGKGTSTVPTLMMEDSAGTVNWRFRDNGSAQQRLKSTAFDEITRRDEKRLYEVVTITTAGAINNQALTAGIFNYRFTACTSLTGLAAFEIGDKITIHNDNTVNMDIPHEDAGSIAANRVYQIALATLSVPPKGKVELMYCTGSRWELVSKNF